ncbi:hypothetical protein SAMN04515647_0705 [Cohaesibacter sp. ES.047]|uniref:hypothetical protein n=1 Tax=Cohaesibacter sp. ES.047 TaxID=1798205 RepID=UPI000BC00821|nr:hypothetical protein [Cohaesibacter sp. ES.047]SNY90537.1 hypothetical protein SAMN04515647_0705 [Cohaesibacter sp. ES.047]
MKDRIGKNWLIIKSSLEALSYVSIIVGIVVAYNSYSRDRAEERVSNALKFIMHFQNNEMMQSRMELQRPWLDPTRARLSNKAGSADIINQIATTIIFPIEEKDTVSDLIRVMDYLDAAASCVAGSDEDSSSVCDKSVILDHLGEFADSMLCLYKAPIEELRTNFAMPKLGTKMEALLNDEPSVNSTCKS